ncbi:hypothetical protein ZIOFF_063246 [Zingiber officinale]|uniref:Uncharacterized protein n=1 Tax=Zingiber officinale TaxID=94328 RepID=A0A8J5KG22_ZINOF|nr:hypothetical protein ZIOFF_063246 [Zingiber officinale]
MVFWCKEEAWLTRVLLTAERSPPARYSFIIPTSTDIFLWTAFRKQRIPAEESDCALFSSELLLNFITDVVGSPGDGVLFEGGDGDVARTLPKALAKRGHRVMVLVITLDSKLFLSMDPAH